jgi:hypothetical protein
VYGSGYNCTWTDSDMFMDEDLILRNNNNKVLKIKNKNTG